MRLELAERNERRETDAIVAKGGRAGHVVELATLAKWQEAV